MAFLCLTKMTEEIKILTITAASIGFFHTLLGPDHYLPFIVMSKARKWSLFKTLWLTVLCGMGHVGSSIVIGLIGIGTGLVHVVGYLKTLSFRGTIGGGMFTGLPLALVGAIVLYAQISVLVS